MTNQSVEISFKDTIRERLPADTLNKLYPLFSKVGITRVAHVTYFDHFYGIYVSNCIRPNSKNLSLAQGKGRSIELSMISAIMESIEAYHLENPSPFQFKSSFLEGSSHSNLIDPHLFALTSFAAALEKIEFDWTTAHNLIDQKQVYIPAALTRINTCPPSMDYLYFNVSTNGLAAGNTEQEAICHALLEIIERDALVKWQNLDEAAKGASRIEINSIDDFNQTFVKQFTRQGLILRVWETTSDMGIPAYHVAIIDEHSVRGLTIFTGTGAYLSKSIALYRAISEAVQTRLTYITGARDDVFEEYYLAMRAKDKKFLPKTPAGQANKSYANSVSLPVENVQQNLQKLLQILAQHDYSKVLMVNHTKPELEIPVVQIFIPGMLLNNARM